MRFDPLQIGFKLLDLPLAVIFALAEQLADVALRTFDLIDRSVTSLIEWALRLVYFIGVTVINLVITLVIHLAYTLANLPRLLLEALQYFFDALDTFARFLVLPLLGYLVATIGLAITVNAAVGYWLAGAPALLLWGVLGTAAFILGIVTCLAAVSSMSPGDTAYWYLLGLAEYLPYPMVVLCILLWLLILLGPRFGIYHFRPGIVTGTLTVVILAVMAYGLLFGRREEENA